MATTIVNQPVTETLQMFSAVAVGRRIRRACNAKDWTTADLSAATGIPKRTLDSYMSGGSLPQQFFERLGLISEALEVSITWILTGEQTADEALLALAGTIEANRQEVDRRFDELGDQLNLAGGRLAEVMESVTRQLNLVAEYLEREGARRRGDAPPQ